MIGFGPSELLLVCIVIAVIVAFKCKSFLNNKPEKNRNLSNSDVIDASLITSITIGDACPDCQGQEHVWCKVKKDNNGEAYIYHNRCGWSSETGQKWEDYVDMKISEGYINYTERYNLIAPWDIRPGMEKSLIGYKGKR